MFYDNRIRDIDDLKKKIDAKKPLSLHAREQLKAYYRIGLTYTSNALEGNSLTETETKIVIEDGLTIGGKPLRDHEEAVGHSDAFDFVYQLAKGSEIREADICKLHHLFYHRIDNQNAGQYRKVNVLITGSEFKPPAAKDVPDLMKTFVKNIPIMCQSSHPVEWAAFVHKEFVTIHPFVDGNGRTARLMMNVALMQKGFPITIIPPIVRNEYIKALQKSQIDPKDEKPFVNFISAMVYESMKEYLRLAEGL